MTHVLSRGQGVITFDGMQLPFHPLPELPAVMPLVSYALAKGEAEAEEPGLFGDFL